MSAFPVFIDFFTVFIQTFLTAIGGLVFLYIVLMIAPLFVQLMITVIVNTINSTMRFNIRPILDLILLPGSLLRMTIVWLILNFYGFEAKLGFTMPRFGDPASNVTGRYNYRGLSPYAFFNRDGFDQMWEGRYPLIKVSFLISLGSYAIMPIVVLMMVFSRQITYSMYFFLPANMVLPMYYFVLVSLFLGGMPVPEETLSVLYVFIMSKPHMLISTFSLFLGALILGPYLGVSLTLLLAAVVFIFNVFLDMTYTANEDKVSLNQELVGLLVNDVDF